MDLENQIAINIFAVNFLNCNGGAATMEF